MFFEHFLNISYYFWVITSKEKVNNFQTAKVHDFRRFQPGVTYKSVAYKKKFVNSLFLLQKDFDIFRVLLFGAFFFVFDNSYLSFLYIEKKIK